MDLLDTVLAVAGSRASVDLQGALACAVACAASLLATLGGFADRILVRDSAAGRLGPGVGLTFGSKVAAAIIAVVAAGVVLAPDEDWFASCALTTAFVAVVAIGAGVLVPHAAAVQTGGP